MKLRHILSIVALLVCTAQVHAAGEKSTNHLRFVLFNGDIKPFTIKDWEEIKGILQTSGRSLDVTILSHKGLSLLHHAAIADIHLLMPHLVHRGAEINAVDRGGNTPLMYAIVKGNLNAVATLLRLGASIEVLPNRSGSAMSLAILHGHTEIVALLIAHGADFPNDLVLDVSFRNENPDMMNLLISYDRVFSELSDALDNALNLDALDDVKWLLQRTLHLGANSVFLHSRANNILHVAVLAQRFDVVAFLIDRLLPDDLADLMNTPNNAGHTPLHLALSMRDQNIARILLLAGSYTLVGGPSTSLTYGNSVPEYTLTTAPGSPSLFYRLFFRSAEEIFHHIYPLYHSQSSTLAVVPTEIYQHIGFLMLLFLVQHGGNFGGSRS